MCIVFPGEESRIGDRLDRTAPPPKADVREKALVPGSSCYVFGRHLGGMGAIIATMPYLVDAIYLTRKMGPHTVLPMRTCRSMDRSNDEALRSRPSVNITTRRVA